MKIGVVIQARMGSSRLPGKVLMPIGDRKLLDHILYKLEMMSHLVSIVVATSMTIKDDVIASFCRENTVDCYRGSESDVLSRYYEVAKQYGFDHIVRLTADNPFVDIVELDRLIALHIQTNADYSRSFSALPKGIGAEVFTFKALETCHLVGHKDNHREHVNEYIEENEHLFKISELLVSVEKNRPDLSLTVDTQSDYEKACYIMNESELHYVTTQEAIRLCMQFV